MTPAKTMSYLIATIMLSLLYYHYYCYYDRCCHSAAPEIRCRAITYPPPSDSTAPMIYFSNIDALSNVLHTV